MKRTVVLPVAVTCSNGHTSDKVVTLPSGPHTKACCSKCGVYIKFLKTGEGAPARAKGEERAGPLTAFLLVSATIRRGQGSLTEPCTVTTNTGLASQIEAALIAKGRIVHVDRIEGMQKERRVRA